ncbi:MAG TPA: Gldg family protein, partial [Planctomycetota bacterium]
MTAALSIARRDLVRWFTNPTGYVFIMVFIGLCTATQVLPPRFFLDNFANLGPLNVYFPYILLFFAPAVAMGTWADERRHGTDELLLTLPVPDGALVAGKFLAALGIYGVALFFSLTLVAVLAFLGRPDIGLMFGTWLGYGLLGAALIAIAMVGSLLVESVTVGFILGALFCAVPVFLGDAAGLVGEALASLGVRGAFRDFTTGVGSLQAAAYFAGLAAVGLAVNLALLQRRRLREGQWHLPVRVACLALSAVSLVILCDRSGLRVDLTAERLHSLSSQTREAIRAIPAGKPVFIQAYVSPEVPQDYVETRENLLSLLRDLDALGGGRVNIRVTETTKATEAAREADDRFRIKPLRLSDREGSRGGRMDVFLGAAVTCGLDEVVVPFFYRGLSPEYELTRSIRVVSKAKRAKVGILSTDAKWFGGFEFTTMQPSQPWAIVEELKKQYEVVQVAPDAAITESMDVLIAPMPSSLTQPQLDNLFFYARQGKPVLLLDDPLPIVNPSIGANEMKGGRRGMMGGSPPEMKGNAREFYRALGLSWEPTDVVWDTYNPHPTLGEFPEEVVFVGRGNGAAEPFNLKSPVSSKLQELVFLFSGCIHSGNVKGIEVTPLLR